MKSLKTTAAERKERDKKYKDMCSPCDMDGGDAYPYGLRLSLNSDTLDKLDMELPKVGKSMTITCKVRVISATQHERENGEKSRDCALQVTDMEFGDGSAEDAVRAAVSKA